MKRLLRSALICVAVITCGVAVALVLSDFFVGAAAIIHKVRTGTWPEYTVGTLLSFVRGDTAQGWPALALIIGAIAAKPLFTFVLNTASGLLAVTHRCIKWLDRSENTKEERADD